MYRSMQQESLHDKHDNTVKCQIRKTKNEFYAKLGNG